MGSLRHKEGEKEMSCKLEHEKGCQYHTEKVEENKSWNEFLEWANELGETESKYFTYINCADYEKIGLLIEYLKSKDYFRNRKFETIDGSSMFSVSVLEHTVKSLRPKEDDEVEKLAEALRFTSIHDRRYGEKDYWKNIAKKAIEIIRGEK